MVGIEEALENLAQAIAEDRAVVNNITGANMNLTSQVEALANHMSTKDTVMAMMQKTINQLQG